MSPKQTVYYFTLWNKVMVEQGWYHLPAVEKDSKRRALHVQAECPASSKGFTNQHFNRFKTACEALIAGHNTGGVGKVDADDARRRLVWRIKDDARKAGLSAEYIIGIARDIHVLGNWEDLDLDSLTNLRNTIHDRASHKLGHDTRNVPQKRHYVLDKIPRAFVPHPTISAPVAASVSDAHDNEPF
jgi:hypothetical protein